MAFGQSNPNDRPPPGGIPSGIASIPFDLLPPGARALGLAGAFTAVADDATAAEANPAGLAILTRPEISLHGRNTSFDLTAFNGDASYADVYDDRPVDPFPLYNEASGDSAAVSFASYVHPFESGAVSLYYYNTGRISDRTVHTAESTEFADFYTFDNKVDLTAEAVGLSAAYRLNDLLAIGGSLRYSRLSLTSRARNSVSFLFDLEDQGPGKDDNFVGVTDNVEFERGVNGEDNDITFNLGLLLNPGGKFSVGLVYKDGGSYTLRSTNAFSVDLACTVTPTQRCGTSGTVDFSAADAIVRNAKIELPDVINLGFAYRPTDLWLVSFDIHHTRFSQLPSQPGSSLIFGAPAPNAFSVVGDNDNSFLAVDRLSNSTTYHLGVEHTFVFGEPTMGMRTLALRGGVFNEKDLGTYSDDEARGLPGVDNRDYHYTVGLGSTFGDHIQVDLGAEFSDDTDNIVLSGIYRF